MDSLLTAPPGHRAWEDLRVALVRLSGRALDDALSKVDAALAGWPPELRYGNDWIEAEDPRAAVVRHYRVNGRQATLPQMGALLAATPTRCVSLSISGKSGEQLARVMADHAAALEHVTHLDLTSARLGEKGAKVLAATGAFANVTHLKLGRCDLDGAAMEALAESPLMAGLVALDLEGNPLGLQGSEALVASLETVRRLSLARCTVGEEGAMAVAGAAMPVLEELDVSWTRAESRALSAWVASTRPALRELDLGSQHSFFDADALESWALPPLEVLGLSRNELGAVGAEALVRCPGVLAASSLELASTELDVPALRTLASAELRATTLDLSHNEVGVEGARALSGAQWMARVEVLKLAGNPVGVAGAMAILEAAVALRDVDLTKTGIDAADAIAGSGSIASLRVLRLDGNAIDARGIHALLSSPHLQVETLSLAQIDPGPMTRLEGPALSFLTTLEVGRNVGMLALETLVSERRPKLESLRLGGDLDEAAVDLIVAHAENLPRARSIQLGSPLRAKGRDALVEKWRRKVLESPRIVDAMVPTSLRWRVFASGDVGHPAAAAQTRHVRLVRDDRFYEVSVEGAEVVTRHGKLGTKGRTTRERFPTTADADAAAERKTVTRTRKGYERSAS